MLNYTDSYVFEHNCNIYIESMQKKQLENFKFIELVQDRINHKLSYIKEFFLKKGVFDIFNNITIDFELNTDKNVSIEITKNNSIYINNSNIENFFESYKTRYLSNIKNLNFVASENILVEIINLKEGNFNKLFFEKLQNYSHNLNITSSIIKDYI